MKQSDVLANKCRTDAVLRAFLKRAEKQTADIAPKGGEISAAFFVLVR